jgi:CheY-like chemotaxis protein
MNKRILVVDDEQNIRDIISELLVHAGHEVVLAVDGMDALEKVQYEKYDLYIVDVFMPRMDGLELVANIREIHPLAVIVVITGFSSIDVAVNAVRKGAYHYLTKPLMAENLLQVVDSGLKYSSEQKEEAGSGQTSAAEQTAESILLRGFSPDQQREFKLMGTLAHFAPGERIPLDEEHGSMIWIESGRVNVYHNGAVVDTIHGGETWGEETFLSPKATFTNLTAQNEVQLRFFKRKRIMEFFTYHAESLSTKYMINLFQSIYIKWRESIYKLGLFSGFFVSNTKDQVR